MALKFNPLTGKLDEVIQDVSDYEAALAAGFSGTYAEWILHLTNNAPEWE